MHRKNMSNYFCKISGLAIELIIVASETYQNLHWCVRIETCVFNRSWQKGTGNCQDFQEQIRGLKEAAGYYRISR